MNTIEIGVAKIAVAKAPSIIITRALGSCVSIILYDPVTRIGGMAHVMLPNNRKIKNKITPGKYADTAVPTMLNEMIRIGARKKKIVAKLVGGAKMFKSVNNDSPIDIGSKIIDAAKSILKKHVITLLTQDIGKDYGRSVKFNTENGSVIVKALKKKSILI